MGSLDGWIDRYARKFRDATVKAEEMKINDSTAWTVGPENSAILPSVTLRTKKDIEEILGRSRAFFRPLHISKLHMAVEGLPTQALGLLEARLNAHLQECGCAASNIAAAAGLLIYVLLLFIFVGTPFQWTWHHLILGIPVCLSLAVFGKLASQFRARLKFIHGLESILKMVQG
jgi:hypothetical protein